MFQAFTKWLRANDISNVDIWATEMISAPHPAAGTLRTAPYYFAALSEFLNETVPPLPPRPPPPPPPPPPPVLPVTVMLIGSESFANRSDAAAACEPPWALCSRADLQNHSAARARPGRLSDLSVSHRKPGSHGAFV